MTTVEHKVGYACLADDVPANFGLEEHEHGHSRIEITPNERPFGGVFLQGGMDCKNSPNKISALKNVN